MHGGGLRQSPAVSQCPACPADRPTQPRPPIQERRAGQGSALAWCGWASATGATASQGAPREL